MKTTPAVIRSDPAINIDRNLTTLPDDISASDTNVQKTSLKTDSSVNKRKAQPTSAKVKRLKSDKNIRHY